MPFSCGSHRREAARLRAQRPRGQAGGPKCVRCGRGCLWQAVGRFRRAQRRGYGIARERGLLKKTRLKTPDFKNIVLYEISRLSCTFEMFSFQVFAFLFFFSRYPAALQLTCAHPARNSPYTQTALSPAVAAGTLSRLPAATLWSSCRLPATLWSSCLPSWPRPGHPHGACPGRVTDAHHCSYYCEERERERELY